jgi:Protein of unknown function (DUF2935).
MLSDRDFVKQSLELNLFFMRIAKEHSIFMEAAFTPRDFGLAREADAFKNHFSMLLEETIYFSNGIISPEVVASGELVTDLTFSAERGTEFYSAIPIDSGITRRELNLAPSAGVNITPAFVQNVMMLNEEAIAATNMLAGYKARLLSNVLACRVFTLNYPLLIDHILREARFYLNMLNKLQHRDAIDTPDEIIEQEVFWNRIMAEHSKFIRGLLDPTEVELIDTAEKFGREFDSLTGKAIELTKKTSGLEDVTEDSLEAAEGIRDFKRQGTQGLIKCRIKSIALPLLGDHVVREANHYIRLLRMFKKEV